MTEQGQQRIDSPLQSERGMTIINEGVVSRIAGLAAGEVEGVRMGGSASRTVGGILENVTGSQGQTRGVSVEVGRFETAIDLTMGIEYGRKILERVEQVRDRISQRVENITGLRVTELNVTVSDVVFPGEEDTERVDLGAARAEAMTRSGSKFSEETIRAEDRKEDETAELRLDDDETGPRGRGR